MAIPTNAHTNYLIILLKSGVKTLHKAVALTEDAYYTDTWSRVKRKSHLLWTFSSLVDFRKSSQAIDLKGVISTVSAPFGGWPQSREAYYNQLLMKRKGFIKINAKKPLWGKWSSADYQSQKGQLALAFLYRNHSKLGTLPF